VTCISQDFKPIFYIYLEGISMSFTKKTSFYTVHNKVELIKGGAEYFHLLYRLIDEAKDSIYIRVYILDDDDTGTTIANKLVAAANRDVQVYVIADGYASQGLSKTYRTLLHKNGIQFRYFEPLLRSSHFYFGRRLHEKIVVIDRLHALVGGINMADRYNDIDGVSAWLDYSLHVTGDAAFQLYKYCAADWHDGSEPPPAGKESLPAAPCSVRVSRNDWVKGKHEVWRTYFNWFNLAEESITIMCSYFLPGRVLRNRLSIAATRGVKVRVILAGPSDVMLAKHAERYLYAWMLRNGIEIYEYQPTVLHAKMMVVDDRLFTIGSFNVNNVSAYASVELNLDIRNKLLATQVKKTMDSIIEQDCIRVTERNFLTNATLFKRFIQMSSYEIIRGILNLSTFYFKHE
jgi:cardiolipin synthase A/B